MLAIGYLGIEQQILGGRKALDGNAVAGKRLFGNFTTLGLEPVAGLGRGQILGVGPELKLPGTRVLLNRAKIHEANGLPRCKGAAPCGLDLIEVVAAGRGAVCVCPLGELFSLACQLLVAMPNLGMPGCSGGGVLRLRCDANAQGGGGGQK